MAELITIDQLGPDMTDEDFYREYEQELADTLAWIMGLANHPDVDVDIQNALIDRYGSSCHKCNSLPCACSVDTIKESNWVELTKQRLA